MKMMTSSAAYRRPPNWPSGPPPRWCTRSRPSASSSPVFQPSPGFRSSPDLPPKLLTHFAIVRHLHTPALPTTIQYPWARGLLEQAISAVLRPRHSCHLTHHSLQPEHCRYGPNVFSPAIAFRTGPCVDATPDGCDLRVARNLGAIRTQPSKRSSKGWATGEDLTSCFFELHIRLPGRRRLRRSARHPRSLRQVEPR